VFLFDLVANSQVLSVDPSSTIIISVLYVFKSKYPNTSCNIISNRNSSLKQGIMIDKSKVDFVERKGNSLESSDCFGGIDGERASKIRIKIIPKNKINSKLSICVWFYVRGVVKFLV
jgi:hypothetical protein